jgi:FixJ family two-component response regulator
MMNAPAPYVAVVDDDASVRKALARLLGASAFHARTYASAQQFLKSLQDAIPQCLIVDLQMPEMTGLELHSELLRAGFEIPTIITTAHDDAGCSDRCRAGGVAYLLKPFDQATLIDAINNATRRG